MSKLFVVLLLIVARGILSIDVPETKLISTFLVYRHGDRTPLLSSVGLTTDPAKVAAASAPFGYGQLTDVGKRRCYKLGKTIRFRYDELLSSRYNKSEIYIRTTEFTRTKMSALTAMAAVYPASPDNWNNKISWDPTPYTSVPAKYDFVLFPMNCPNFFISYRNRMKSDSLRIHDYVDILNITAASSGQNLTSTPVIGLFKFYDAYVSQSSLGIPLSPEIAEIMPQLKKAADEAIDILLGNDEYITYEGGVLMDEFINQADKLICGKDTPRVRIYSAHESTVYSFETAARVFPRQGDPEYAAYFALELRMDIQSREYVVLPVYQRNPDEDPIYLPVSGCDSLLCPYDNFKQLVSKYALDEDTWRTKCGFTNDLVIDQSNID